MRYLKLLKTFVHFTFLQETFDRTNNWTLIISALFYALSQILFIQVLYANSPNLAGYNRNEMLIFLLIGQISYYIMWTVHFNLEDVIQFVNTGQLDSILMKPIPSLFYVTFRKIRLFSILRDCLAPLIVMIAIINWSSITWQLESALAGILILTLGIICVHCLYLIATCSVFWLGESITLFTLTSDFEYLIGKVIPYEAFASNIRFVLTTFFPILLTAGLSTSVILGKSPIVPSVVTAVIVTFFALFVRQYVWKQALKVYTSASS